MYEERNTGFSFKDFILQLLFVILFILLLVWLFPTKTYVDEQLENAGVQTTNSKIDSLYKKLYTDNLETMKSAAKSYFTDERLPKNVGDTVKITLQEMYDEKIILPIYDSNNKKCNAKKSYVEITKKENEYVLKAYLACSDNKDYVLEYLGCYTYCNSGLCQVEDNKTESTNVTVTKEPITKEYEYQYKKVTDGKWGDYGEWSEWTKNTITENEYTKVDTKVETEKKEVSKYGKIGTKTVSEIKTEDFIKSCPNGYTLNDNNCIKETTEKLTENPTLKCSGEYKLNGNTCTKTTTSTKTVNATANTTGSWVTLYSSKLYSAPQTSTSTMKYTLIATKTKGACGNCTYTVNYFYKVEKYNTTTTYSCPSGYTLNGSTCSISTTNTLTENPTKSCPANYNLTNDICVYNKTNVLTADISYSCKEGYNKVDDHCEKLIAKTEDVYGYYTDYEEVKVTYYRSKTRKYISGTIDYKWSRSQNDTSLLNQGYSLTGKSREV